MVPPERSNNANTHSTSSREEIPSLVSYPRYRRLWSSLSASARWGNAST